MLLNQNQPLTVALDLSFFFDELGQRKEKAHQGVYESYWPREKVILQEEWLNWQTDILFPL